MQKTLRFRIIQTSGAPTGRTQKRSREKLAPCFENKLMPAHEIDREPAKCRRHEMFIDSPHTRLRAPLGAARVIAEKDVAPTGLNRLVRGTFYRHAAPRALETAKDGCNGESRARSQNRF